MQIVLVRVDEEKVIHVPAIPADVEPLLDEVVKLIQEQQEINHQFAKALDLVGDGHYVFGVNNKFYDAAMLVLKEAVNDKYDYISWWLYEGEPDYKVWSSDNTEEWNLTEPEALYDFIVNECQE